MNSTKPSQPLYPPSCPHTVNSTKPSQQLHPPSCPHTINSTEPSQTLFPPSCHHTSEQFHTTSVSHTPCHFTKQEWHDQCSSFLSRQHRFFQICSPSDSHKCITMYKQLSSFPFKPCSWLRKAAQQIKNDLCKYTAGSNNYFNAINNKTLWFQWPT